MSSLLFPRASESCLVRFVRSFPFGECDPLYEDLFYCEMAPCFGGSSIIKDAGMSNVVCL